MLKTLSRVICAAVLLLLTALMAALAYLLPETVFAFYTDFSKTAVGLVGKLSALTPFTLWELLLAVLILWAVVRLIVCIRKARFGRWVSGVLLTVSLGLFLFVGLWGLNYYAPPLGQRLDIPRCEHSSQELAQATRYFMNCANRLAGELPRQEDGSLAAEDFSLLAEEVPEAFAEMALQYPYFSKEPPRVKYLLTDELISKTGTTGMFICLTGESGVSRLTYEVSLPFTMCHEAAHAMALAREDEANFAAFLACIHSPRADFRYSGYYNAFLYCYNALYRTDPDAAKELRKEANELLNGDLRRAGEHYEALRNEKATEITDRVYDSYLKSFSVSEGKASYSQVVELLMDWYAKEIQ